MGLLHSINTEFRDQECLVTELSRFEQQIERDFASITNESFQGQLDRIETALYKKQISDAEKLSIAKCLAAIRIAQLGLGGKKGPDLKKILDSGNVSNYPKEVENVVPGNMKKPGTSMFVQFILKDLAKNGNKTKQVVKDLRTIPTKKNEND